MPTFTTTLTDKLPASALLGNQQQVITSFTPQGHLPVLLLSGTCLQFQRVPTAEIITGIRLRFGTYCRDNDSHLTVVLTAHTTCEIRLHASQLPDSQFIDLALPLPHLCTPGQPVTITLYSDDATSDNAVAVWCSDALPTFLNTLTLIPLYFPLPAGKTTDIQERSASLNQDIVPPRVSIVIPVFNKVLYTYNCLLTVQACDTQLSKEVIIVNNASSDETSLLLKQLQGAVKIINNVDNQGFVQACRQGAEVATGEFIVFLNNDTQVTPGWLTNMVTVMDVDPTVGITGSKLIYPDGRLQEAGGIIFNDASGCNYGRYQDPTDPRYNHPRAVDYCSGASLMIRTTLWKQLGGFDQRFAPAYYEDTDLCFAVRQAGYQVWYCPDSEVIHHEGITAGTNLNSGYKAYQVVNQKKFRTKWRQVLATQHLPPQTSPQAAAWRLTSAPQLTFRIPPHKIIACHLFGQGWAANFWSYLTLHTIDADLAWMKSFGFNTVILLMPWVGFQTQISPITYYEAYFTLFQQLLEKIQAAGLSVILRLGYTHDNGPASEPEGYLRQIVIGADTATWQAWTAYLDRLWQIAQPYPNLLGGFITWEDFFLMDLTHIPPASRLLYATRIGYQSYLQQHYSLATVSEHYQQTFTSFADVPIPAYKNRGIRLFCEFWDDLLINRVFKGSKPHFPKLAMEVRIDCDPEGEEGNYICHADTFDLTAEDFVTMIYYSPAWGAHNDGQPETADRLLTRMRLLFEDLHSKTGNVILIDQFNFIDNTPGFERHTRIVPEQIPEFLVGATKLLQQHTLGYGLWTLHDVPANALRNGIFSQDYPAWEITHGDLVTDTSSSKHAARLFPGGRLTQTVSNCWGVPVVAGQPFQLDLQGRNLHSANAKIAIRVLDSQQVIDEHTIRWTGTDFQAIHVDRLRFAKGNQLQVENQSPDPLLLTDFYLYQLYQENGMIDAEGELKAFGQALVKLNRQLATGESSPPKSYFHQPDLSPPTLDGIFPDHWMGHSVSGLIMLPAVTETLYFIVKAYIPDHWNDCQNTLTLTLVETHYQASQPVQTGYQELKFGPCSTSQQTPAVSEFELVATAVYSPSQYEPASQDHRQISMLLLEMGWVNEV